MSVATPLAPLDVGSSIIISTFNLSTEYVFHIVCHRFLRDSDDEIKLLSKAYNSALNSFNDIDLNPIAFVSIGTGVYRCPIELASQIVINELIKSKHEATMMCVIDEKTKKNYSNMLDNVK